MDAAAVVVAATAVVIAAAAVVVFVVVAATAAAINLIIVCHFLLSFSYPALKNGILSTDLMTCSCFPTMLNNGALGSVIFYHVYNSYILI